MPQQGSATMMAKPRITANLWLTLALAGLSLALAAVAGWSEPALQFDRGAIADGQWWRLLSGQLVHYGFLHTLNNVLALLLIGAVLWSQQPFKLHLLLWVVCLAAVGLGLYFFSPELDYYAGLSGALHGLLIAGLLLDFRRMPLLYSAGLIVAVVKIWQEQQVGYDTSHIMLPVPVAVDSHLYGALAGLAVTAILLTAVAVKTREGGNPPK